MGLTRLLDSTKGLESFFFFFFYLSICSLQVATMHGALSCIPRHL